MGRLIPIFCEEVLPKDIWSISSAFKLELAPLIAPLMHNLDVYEYFFYVPNYILSSAWNSWISQGEPADSPNIPYPCRFVLSGTNRQLSAAELASNCGPGSLLDYLGFSNESARTNTAIPGSVSELKDYSCFPFLAYNAIWLNYFRNENLTPLPNSWGNFAGFNASYDVTTNVNLADWKSHNFYYRNNVIAPITSYLVTDDEDTESDPLRRLLPHAFPRHANFMHDYFTASLPFTQRGPVVRIPLGDTAPVTGTAQVDGAISITNPHLSGGPVMQHDNIRFSAEGTSLMSSQVVNFVDPNSSSIGNNAGIASDQSKNNPVTDIYAKTLEGNDAAANVSLNDLEVDLSEATGISILDLRRFARLQAWLEKNAVGGNTPGENLRNHFGVRPSDQSLDRPVFLGGGRIPLSISNVLQTSQSTDTSALATPSGYARSQGFAGFKNRRFREHGWIIGLAYVMPRSKYMQGTRRYWDRSSRFDYFWPEFERIGEQPVWNWEIYDDGTTGVNNQEFGYNPRYADYKYIPSSVHGDFKTNLSFWHAARIFSSRPNLNSNFMHLGNDIDRIFAVQSSLSKQNCWFWIRNQVRCRRPMRKNPSPILG